MSVLVMFTLRKIELTTLASLLNRIAPGSETPGEAGIVGARLVADGFTFGLRMTPVLDAKRQMTFPRCFIPNDGILEHEKGNTATQRTFVVRAIRDAAGVFYTETTTGAP